MHMLRNCPTRLTMYHLFSLDPMWIYLQTSNAFKPILLAVCFAAYCSRYATDMWGKDRKKLIRDFVKIVYLLGFF